MKTRKFLLLALTVFLAIFLVACGEGNNNGTNDSTDIGNTRDTADFSDTNASSPENGDDSSDIVTEAAPVSIFLGENDIEKYSIVFSGDNIVEKNISEYLSEKIKAISGKDIVSAESAQGLEYAIIIGVNSLPDAELGDNEFIIKLVENDLYISYSEGATAFQAVSTVLEDALFASHNKVGDAHTLASDFEFSGKCGDYVIGDNEFNPFE